MAVEIIGAVSSALNAAKLVKNAADAVGSAELKLQIAELISALADVKMQAAESQERIRQLESELEARANMVFIDSVYYSGEGDAREGPWCQRCYDVDSKLVRLQSPNNGYWTCRECKNAYPGGPGSPKKVHPRLKRSRKPTWV